MEHGQQFDHDKGNGVVRDQIHFFQKTVSSRIDPENKIKPRFIGVRGRSYAETLDDARSVYFISGDADYIYSLWNIGLRAMRELDQMGMDFHVKQANCRAGAVAVLNVMGIEYFPPEIQSKGPEADYGRGADLVSKFDPCAFPRIHLEEYAPPSSEEVQAQYDALCSEVNCIVPP